MANVSIQNMSIEEKLLTMELLWDDLCKHNALESPARHGTVLECRESERESSLEKPMDWSEAKKEILKKTQ